LDVFLGLAWPIFIPVLTHLPSGILDSQSIQMPSQLTCSLAAAAFEASSFRFPAI